jgi:hypothetical protein
MKQNRAYSLVRSALKNGVLVRPDTCQKCGDKPQKASDGRSKIHAHHHDYDKPLDVEWLCSKCHRSVTPLPSVIGAPVTAERNGQSKLNANAVRDIRSSALGCARLGKKYGVDKKQIQRVRRGEAWTTIK